MATSESEQAFYDEMWDRYAHLDAVSPAAFHRRRLVVRAASKARSVRAILDVGCGQGELLREVAAGFPGASVHGADLSQQSLADSCVRNPGYDLFQLDLADPDFAEHHRDRLGSFDLVTCCEVLEHIPDHESAAANLASLLAPGGTAVVTVPGGKMSRFDEIIGHQRHYTPRKLRGLLSGAGLDVRRVWAWGFPFHSVYRTAVRVASRLTMSEPGKASSESTSGALGTLYTLAGKTLKPLFYLNASVLGEQLIALARKRDR